MNNTQSKKNNGLSIAGFICALCGFITCGVTSIVGLILSIIGLSESKKRGESDGLAIAGIIISSIPLVIGVLLLAVASSSSSITDTADDKAIKGEITNKENKKTYTKVDIDTMEDELENNAAAAKDTYKDKYLEITGKLDTIDSDLKYISLISATKEWDLVGIHCSIKNATTKDTVKTLTRGQTIIIRGKITDVGEVLGYYLDIDEIIPQ